MFEPFNLSKSIRFIDWVMSFNVSLSSRKIFSYKITNRERQTSLVKRQKMLEKSLNINYQVSVVVRSISAEISVC